MKKGGYRLCPQTRAGIKGDARVRGKVYEYVYKKRIIHKYCINAGLINDIRIFFVKNSKNMQKIV